MRNRIENARRKAQLPKLPIKYPVEVEAAAMDQLRIVASDIGGNRFFRSEVEHGASNGPQGAVRDLAAGDRRELTSVDPHQIRVDRAITERTMSNSSAKSSGLTKIGKGRDMFLLFVKARHSSLPTEEPLRQVVGQKPSFSSSSAW